MDETRPNPDTMAFREWTAALAADPTFAARVNALAERVRRGELTDSVDSTDALKERLARLMERRNQ